MKELPMFTYIYEWVIVYTPRNTMSIIMSKGVFKVQTPPPREIFRFFFLKSKGKEIERKKRDVGGGGVTF